MYEYATFPEGKYVMDISNEMILRGDHFADWATPYGRRKRPVL
jgi:hypothetical protein